MLEQGPPVPNSAYFVCSLQENGVSPAAITGKQYPFARLGFLQGSSEQHQSEGGTGIAKHIEHAVLHLLAIEAQLLSHIAVPSGIRSIKHRPGKIRWRQVSFFHQPVNRLRQSSVIAHIYVEAVLPETHRAVPVLAPVVQYLVGQGITIFHADGNAGIGY